MEAAGQAKGRRWPKRSPALSGSRRGSGGGRGAAGRGQPPWAGSCPHGNLPSKRRGRWLLLPCGHGEGLFSFNGCPGGQGGFLHRVLSQRPADAAPLSPSPAAGKAAMAEGPAPSSGLLRKVEGAEGRAGERRGNAAEGAVRLGSEGELRGERDPGLWGQ